MTQHFLKPSLITLFTLTLVACGGKGTPSETTEAVKPVETGVAAPAQIPDGPGDIVAPDHTPPKIRSISPKNNAKGVSKDAHIKFVFSEKMNKAKTQAAYDSADLPKNKVTFHWNATGTELTIKPKKALAYGKTYQFKLTNKATDLAGNRLPTQINSFTIIRIHTRTIEVTSDGWIRSDGDVNISDSDVRVGDSGLVRNSTYRGYLSFRLNSLPGSLTSNNILSAYLQIYKNKVIGNPYTDLDSGSQKLLIDHVNYGSSLTYADFDPIVYSTLGNISTTTSLGYRQQNVLNALRSDVQANRSRSQYRLRFPRLTDGDKQADAIHFRSRNYGNANYRPRLTVTYLIP